MPPSSAPSTSLLSRAWALARAAHAGLRLSRAQEETVAQNAGLYLNQALGQLKGLPQKLGQILSMGHGPAAPELASLTGQATPLDFALVEQILARQWGRPWQELLESLEPVGLAASLGQVHRGVLKDGRPVAVKVQYPGMAQALEADLKLLGWLMVPVGGLRRGFDLDGYRQVVVEDLATELDYGKEAENQHRYRLMAQYIPGLVVPPLVGELCTSVVLVCGWEDGQSLEEVAHNWPEEDRLAAARLFLQASFHTLFRNGLTQADLHPGNYRFRKNLNNQVELVLYDFGCLFAPDKAARVALCRLLDMTQENGQGDPYPLFLKLGFNPALMAPLAHRLPALCRVLFEPMVAQAPYPLHRWRLGERVADVLAEDRWNFRVAGPPELIWLMRIFHGLTHAVEKLGVAAPWGYLLAPIRQELAAEPLELPDAPDAARSFAGMAKHLRMEVARGGEIKVKISGPLTWIDNLKDNMDDEVLARLEARSIDLEQLARQVRKGGYKPQQVFVLQEGEKEIRVWLE